MATELGVGYVTILPSARGFSNALTKQLAPLDAIAGKSGTTAGQSFGGRLSSAIGSAGDKIVGSLGRKIANLAKAGGVGAALFAGTALKLGYDRLTTIEDSTAQLTNQLGSASKAAKFTQAILDTVSGTPFNLDQFLQAGSSLVSMGADAQKVPGYLTAIGNVAATKGKNANEFAGRLSDSFGKATTLGKLTGDTLFEMAQAGVPALKILANHFGISTIDAQKMVSKGLIPAGEGLDIITKGIGSGTNGAAGRTAKFSGNMEALRKTTSGAAGGFKSAMARIGAAVLKPALPLLAKAATAGADALDGLGKKIPPFVDNIKKKFTQLMDKFRSDGTLDKVKNAFNSIKNALAKVKDRLVDVTKKVASFIGKNPGPVLAALAVVVGGVLVAAVWSLVTAVVALLSPFVLVVAAVALIAAGFVLAYQKVGWFKDTVDAVAAFITGTLVPAFKTLWAFVSTYVLPVLKWLAEKALAGVISWFKIAAALIRNVVIPVFRLIITNIIEVAKWVGDKVSAIVGFVTGIGGRISKSVSTLWNGLTTGITAAKKWIQEKINNIVDFVASLPARIVHAVKGAWDGLKNGFKSVINWIIQKWNAFKLPSFHVKGTNINIGGVGLPHIDELHTGGVVPGGASNEPIYKLQGGEVVLSRAQVKAFDAAGATPAGARGSVFSGPVIVNSGTDIDALFQRAGWALSRGGL